MLPQGAELKRSSHCVSSRARSLFHSRVPQGSSRTYGWNRSMQESLVYYMKNISGFWRLKPGPNAAPPNYTHSPETIVELDISLAL